MRWFEPVFSTKVKKENIVWFSNNHVLRHGEFFLFINEMYSDLHFCTFSRPLIYVAHTCSNSFVYAENSSIVFVISPILCRSLGNRGAAVRCRTVHQVHRCGNCCIPPLQQASYHLQTTFAQSVTKSSLWSTLRTHKTQIYVSPLSEKEARSHIYFPKCLDLVEKETKPKRREEDIKSWCSYLCHRPPWSVSSFRVAASSSLPS